VKPSSAIDGDEQTTAEVTDPHVPNGDANGSASCPPTTPLQPLGTWCPLGPLCETLRDLDPGVARLHEALRTRPDLPDPHTDLGVLFTRRDRLDAGLLHLRRARELAPNQPGVYNNLGIGLARQGQLTDAVAHYQEALRLQPDFPQAHYNLANVLRRLDRLDEAAQHYEQALRSKPHDFQTRRRLGLVRLDQDRPTDALPHLREALRLQPRSVDALNYLGVALTKLGQAEEAAGLFEQALRLRPRAPGIHNNYGIALARLGRFAEAVAQYQQSLRLAPNAAGTLCNLGNALRDQGLLDEALTCFQESLRLAPNAADTHNNLAIAHVKLRRLDAARTYYEETLRRQPDFAEGHVNRAHLLLLQGDFAGGWPEYEWRWRCKDAQPFRCRQPAWDGSPLAGRTILLTWEQGFGDTLMYVRVAPLVKAQGGTVLLLCQPRLLELLRRCPGIDRVVPNGEPLPEFDVHAPLATLPCLLGTTVETIPAAVPYLLPDPALVEGWRLELPPDGTFRVGIAWQGNPRYGGDRHRSIPLRHFLPLARLPGVRLVSLQKGLGSEQLRSLPAGNGIVELGSRLDETDGAFLDTAAVMQHLDLVITSDTSIAHLAGGLGVPVWMAVNFSSDWRWLLEREDSPWYPTMRLFRQRRFGSWGEVFERIAALLRQTALRRRVERLQVPTSVGGLLDRITRLMNQSQRLAAPEQQRHVRSELHALVTILDQTLPASAELTELSHQLIAVNEELWQTNEALRQCEARQEFGPAFVELARRLCRQQDQRAALKRQINERAGSFS
jgi:tetratricopeptide (TPR) repeat protein